MFALTLMQGPVKILIANVRIGLYGNMNYVVYRYLGLIRLNNFSSIIFIMDYSVVQRLLKCLSMSPDYINIHLFIFIFPGKFTSPF